MGSIMAPKYSVVLIILMIKRWKKPIKLMGLILIVLYATLYLIFYLRVQ